MGTKTPIPPKEPKREEIEKLEIVETKEIAEESTKSDEKVTASENKNTGKSAQAGEKPKAKKTTRRKRTTKKKNAETVLAKKAEVSEEPKDDKALETTAKKLDAKETKEEIVLAENIATSEEPKQEKTQEPVAIEEEQNQEKIAEEPTATKAEPKQTKAKEKPAGKEAVQTKVEDAKNNKKQKSAAKQTQPKQKVAVAQKTAEKPKQQAKANTSKTKESAENSSSAFAKTCNLVWQKFMYFLWNVFFALPFMRFVGAVLYDLGFQGEYRVYLIWRFIRKVGRFFKNVVWKRWRVLVKHIKNGVNTVWHELLRPFYVFFKALYRIGKHGREVGKEKGFAQGLWAALCYMGRGLKLYIKVLPAMVSYVLPFIALAFLWVIIQESISQEYTLAVQVNGVTVGNVANEQIFESAKSDVQERVDHTGAEDTASFDISPTYVLSTDTRVMTQTQMTDAILETSKEEIAEGTALYVDGELRAVTAGGEELKAFFTDLTAPYEDPSDPNLTVRFNKDIEFVDGLYFTESFTDYQEVTEEMSGLEQAEVLYTVVTGDSWSMIATKNGLTQAEIFNMNPGISVETAIFPGDQFIVATEQSVLEVLIIRQEEYDEVIPYQTEKSKSDEYAFGVVKVLQDGVDGLRHVTAEVIYDTYGNVISKEIISNPVVVEPINRIEVTGTRLESGMIAQVGNGTFMWPVPGYTYVSRWAYAGHKGVDLAAPSGTPILAADAGVVLKAGWNGAGSGYGYSLIIDHGNGYQTLYAHAVALYVGVGDVVAQGQIIAGVGTTGYSTGNHLHLEIRRNGALIYPQEIYGYGY